MNHSEIYWTAFRLAGLIMVYKAIVVLIEILFLGSYHFYSTFRAGEDCGSIVSEIVSLNPLVHKTIHFSIFSALSYYLLFKGNKLHAFVFKKFNKANP